MGFVMEASVDQVADRTTHEIIRHVVDTVGCGAGGFTSHPARIARAMVVGGGGRFSASAYGLPAPGLVDTVGFANATANRYLDFNDFGPSGHPSDMIPALLAMAEACGASGDDAILAISIAYGIAGSIADAVPRDLGWDQGAVSALGVAGGLAKLMRLSKEQTAHALSLAVVPSVPLKVTRYGELSEWKASAVPHASMMASFTARLAHAGMAGPPEPFEGHFGLFDQVWPRFLPELDVDSLRAIEHTSIKKFGACFWGQAAIDVAARLHTETDLSSVKGVTVFTTESVYRAIGGGSGDAAEKWNPRSRETADHSMPFLVASALRDGAIDRASFTEARMADPELRALMGKVTVVPSAEFLAAPRDSCPVRVMIERTDGSRSFGEQALPAGHPDLPLTDRDIDAKFDGLIAEVLSVRDGRDLKRQLWDLSQLENLTRLGALFRRFGTA